MTNQTLNIPCEVCSAPIKVSARDWLLHRGIPVICPDCQGTYADTLKANYNLPEED